MLTVDSIGHQDNALQVMQDSIRLQSLSNGAYASVADVVMIKTATGRVSSIPPRLRYQGKPCRGQRTRAYSVPCSRQAPTRGRTRRSLRCGTWTFCANTAKKSPSSTECAQLAPRAMEGASRIRTGGGTFGCFSTCPWQWRLHRLSQWNCLICCNGRTPEHRSKSRAETRRPASQVMREAGAASRTLAT